MLKNIDRKTLVIFQLSRSLREIHARFLPTRDHSVGRYLGFTRQGCSTPPKFRFTPPILCENL